MELFRYKINVNRGDGMNQTPETDQNDSVEFFRNVFVQADFWERRI